MVPTVSGDEFRAYLESSDVTNADAARILGASLPSVQNWLRDGIGGSAGQFVRFLIAADVPLIFVAAKLDIHMSKMRRLRSRET